MPIAKRPHDCRESEDNFGHSSLAAKIDAIPRQHDNDHPLWAGPSGIGPLGGITQSMIGRFLDCRECFRLKYVVGLEPHPKWNHRLGYGDMWHVCEEAHARGENWRERLQNHCLEVAHGRLPTETEDIAKWMNVVAVQFPEYVRHWANHPDVLNRKPLMQEQVFDVPYNLPSGRVVRLRGKFDSVDLINNAIYLQENKTKGDIDKLQLERQLRFDLQTMLYMIALADVLEDMELDEYHMLGVRYNVVRRPLSGGVGNIRPHAEKRTKKTYAPAESAEEFYERLRKDYISADPDYWFFRVRSEVGQYDIQKFRLTCLDPLLETLCDWYDYLCVNDPTMSTVYATALNYRTPFGIYHSETTEYDHYLETGSEVGLRRVTTLFPELQ